MTVFGGRDGACAAKDGLAVCDPALDSWTDTTLATGPSPGRRFGHTAVCANHGFLAWGGAGATGSLRSGASFEATARRLEAERRVLLSRFGV